MRVTNRGHRNYPAESFLVNADAHINKKYASTQQAQQNKSYVVYTYLLENRRVFPGTNTPPPVLAVAVVVARGMTKSSENVISFDSSVDVQIFSITKVNASVRMLRFSTMGSCCRMVFSALSASS